MAGISTLSDTFEDGTLSSTLWPTQYGSPLPSETGGRARIPCSTTYAGIISQAIYSFDTLSVEPFPPAKNGASADCYATVMLQSNAQPDGTTVGFYIDRIPATPVLYCVVWSSYFDAASVSVNYNATNHAWLHLTYNGSTIVWQSSLTQFGTRTTLRTMSSGLPSWRNNTDFKLYFDTHRDAGTANVYEIGAVNPPTATTVNGTMAASLPTVTGTAVGVRTVSGALAANPGGPTGIILGRRTTSGTSAASLGPLSATVAGKRTVPGTAAVTLGALSATIAGKRTVQGTSVANLGGVSGSIIGKRTVRGVAVASLPGLSASASADGTISGTANATLGPLGATIAGKRTVRGVAVASLGPLGASLLAEGITSGTALATLPRLVATIAGRRTVLGAASAALPAVQGRIAVQSAGGALAWDGSTWVPATIYARKGGQWVPAVVKQRRGDDWYDLS